MRSDWAVRGFGVTLLLGALPALLWVDEPLGGMLAFALAVTGLFIAWVVPERVIPAAGAEALLRGGSDPIGHVAAGLQLKGRPIYVPDQGNVGGERLFLPASENPRPVPILDRETLTYTGSGDTKLGVAIPPAGLALVDRHEADTGTQLAGASIPEVEAFLRGLTRTHDLARGVRVTEESGGFQVRFATAAVRPPCLEDAANPRCESTGCALCQASVCALVRSLGKPLTISEAHIADPWVRLHLQSPEAPT